MLSRNGYSKSVDWWALGALCYEMLAGKPPFQAKSEKDLFKKIMSEKFLCPSYLTPAAHSLLRGLLEKDASKRLGASKSNRFTIGGVTALKQHEFFSDLDWNDVVECRLTPPIDVSPVRKVTAALLNNHSVPTAAGAGSDAVEAAALNISENSSVVAVVDGNSSVGGDKFDIKSLPESQVISVDMFSEFDDWTCHFHEGFTHQDVSYSILEDAYSMASAVPSASTSALPSHAPSDDEHDEDDHELYAGFEFAGPSVKCTPAEYRMLQADIVSQGLKMQRKKKLRLQKEEERNRKEAERLQQQALEAQAKLAEQERKQKLEAIKQERIEREKKAQADKLLVEKVKNLRYF